MAGAGAYVVYWRGVGAVRACSALLISSASRYEGFRRGSSPSLLPLPSRSCRHGQAASLEARLVLSTCAGLDFLFFFFLWQTASLKALRSAVSRGSEVHVISVNWSKDLILATLQHSLAGKSRSFSSPPLPASTPPVSSLARSLPSPLSPSLPLSFPSSSLQHRLAGKSRSFFLPPSPSLPTFPQSGDGYMQARCRWAQWRPTLAYPGGTCTRLIWSLLATSPPAVSP